MSDNGQILAQFERYGEDQIRIQISQYQGHTRLDMRTWYPDAETGEYKATRKGVKFKADEIEAVIAALEQARLELAETAESEQVAA